MVSPFKLTAFLRAVPESETHGSLRRFIVAYSGGMDSHVLLHALCDIRSEMPDLQLLAVHINHGLQTRAQQWSEHCQQVCKQLDVSCEVIDVDASPAPGESPEAAARNARYNAIKDIMHNGDVLLTAHHQDDQAETLLLQLMRGGGPRGLAAMPVCASFCTGYHCRPLLEYPRDELHRYAEQHQLEWVEDASNADTGFDRNFIRHDIMPQLKRRWPAAARTISRVAAHSAEAARLTDMLAENDLAYVTAEEGTVPSVDRLLIMEPARARNVLRAWIRRSGFPLPATGHMERIMADVLLAAEDSSPCVGWEGAELRRYRDRLYIMAPLTENFAGVTVPWDLCRPVVLPNGLGTLRPEPVSGEGLRADLPGQAPVSIRFRQGGEQCRLAGRGHTHSLKKLFQEQGVPPWERDRIPFIYVGDDLAAVADLWVCEPYQAQAGDPGICVNWDLR